MHVNHVRWFIQSPFLWKWTCLKRQMVSHGGQIRKTHVFTKREAQWKPKEYKGYFSIPSEEAAYVAWSYELTCFFSSIPLLWFLNRHFQRTGSSVNEIKTWQAEPIFPRFSAGCFSTSWGKTPSPKPNQAGTRGDQRFLAETGLSDLGWSWMLVLHALLNPRSRGHYLQAVLKTTLFLLGHTKSFRLQVSLGWIANRFLQIVANCIEIVFSLENTFAILFAQAISWIRFFAGKVWW